MCRILFFYLRSEQFSGLKPANSNMTFFAVFTGRFTGGTMPPSMLEDGYINFWGFPGVIFIMSLNGILFGLANHAMRRNMVCFLAIGPYLARIAIMSVRGQPYELMTGLISMFVMVWAVWKSAMYLCVTKANKRKT